MNKTFNEHVQKKLIPSLAQEIVENLVKNNPTQKAYHEAMVAVESYLIAIHEMNLNYFDALVKVKSQLDENQTSSPSKQLNEIFVKNYGKNHVFNEAFEGQNGTWGNLGKGLWNGAKWLGGKVAQGVGGLAGGIGGGIAGAARGAVGANPSLNAFSGAKTGGSFGKNMSNNAGNNVSQAYNNRSNAAMVSGYRGVMKAIDGYAGALRNIPNSTESINQLNQAKDIIEKLSSEIENAGNPSNVVPFSSTSPTRPPEARSLFGDEG